MFCQFWCVCPLHCVCVCVCVCIIAFSAFDFKNWIALKRNEEKYNLKSEVESVCVEEREKKLCVCVYVRERVRKSQLCKIAFL